ncbi:NADAR family protein [Elizabethkingia bruuniana]|uniref:hypothetical protein n=1 Tax=Elizabethkingia bruuniana TaxID=1756149 RepID=UPI000BEAF667|nr:hypothetical protein [Elizabethkingia bruuniana]ATL41798.1 hypothetical protein CQS02_00020 [Elizabethkingia miricola]MCL1636252.1 hypothetical protein [Elizabethkingia bruuniana]
MNFIENVYQYLFYAPEEIKFNWYQDDVLYFNGFKFHNDKVEYMNIYTFDTKNYYNPEYLDVTVAFTKFKKKVNPYHLTHIINDCLKKYHRESEFTENHTPILNNFDEQFKPKRHYQINKHRGRHLKFITSDRDFIHRWWNNLLCRAIEERLYSSPFVGHFNERPNSMFFPFS